MRNQFRIKSAFKVRLFCFVACVAPWSIALSAWGHHVPDKDVVTLYRSSVAGVGARYHVATFDADTKTVGGTRFLYNWENCSISARLRMDQPGVITRFWCERGYAKPDFAGK